MQALEEKTGHTHNLGAFCLLIQTGQPVTVCSDLSAVNSARLSLLLLMTGQIILRVARLAVIWVQQPPSPPHGASHTRTRLLLTYQPHPFHKAGLAGVGLSELTMASATTLSLFSGLQPLCSLPAPQTLVPLETVCVVGLQTGASLTMVDYLAIPNL